MVDLKGLLKENAFKAKVYGTAALVPLVSGVSMLVAHAEEPEADITTVMTNTATTISTQMLGIWRSLSASG